MNKHQGPSSIARSFGTMLGVFSAALFTPVAVAQYEVYDVPGSETALYGARLAALGDVDSDGVPD